MTRQLLILAVPCALLAQEPAVSLQRIEPDNVQKIKAEARSIAGAAQFVAVETVGAAVVKNAPYSADAVTETVQVLADGNKISRKNTVTQYRDSEGRTRREFEVQFMSQVGAPETSKSVMIDDPVGKVRYSLDLRNKVAMVMPGGGGMFNMAFSSMPAAAPLVGMNFSAAGSPAVSYARTARPAEAGGEGGSTTAFGHANSVTIVREGVVADRLEAAPTVAAVPALPTISPLHTTQPDNAKTENLGSRNIEGVEARGTRTTLTIPAGAVGNEREINIVSERWYSEQLKMIVMSRHSDPRFGDTTLTLTNLRLSEPPAPLFEVPADFTKQEPPAPTMMRMRKPQE